MNIAIDVDGTLDAFPVLFQHLIAGWTAAADHVYILTGIGSDVATDEDHAAKVQYLNSLGVPPESYYQLVVVPTKDGEDHAQAKADYIAANNIRLLIDNNVDNCKAAKAVCAVFCLWNVKQKSEDGLSIQAKDKKVYVEPNLEPRATKLCANCGATVSSTVETCPMCGEDLSVDTSDGLSEPNNDRLPIR